MDYQIIPILEDIARALEKIERHLDRLTKEKEKSFVQTETNNNFGGFENDNFG